MLSTTERLPDWSIMLSNRVNSEPPEFRAKLLDALGIGDQTLYRWMRGRNKPDSKSKVRTLIRYIPEMAESLREAFPQYFTSPHDINRRLVAPYTQKVLEAYGDVEAGLLQRAVTNTVLDGLVTLLDPTDEIGVVAVLVQLFVNPNAYLTAHAWSAHGTGMWAEKHVFKSYTVGAPSLSALAVTQGGPAFYPRDRNALIPAGKMEQMECVKSAASYPIRKSGHVAGTIFIVSAQEHFFESGLRDLTDRRDLIERFVRMMPLAFRDDQFYVVTPNDFLASGQAEQQYLDHLALDYPNETREQLKERAVARIRES